MNKAKRILSLVMVILLVLGAGGLMLLSGILDASAASGDTFFFQKPSDWNDDVYVYWWGVSNSPSWPGVKMTKVSDGLYSFKATSTFTDFNINDGGADNVKNPHQTVDLKFPADGMCGVIGTSAGNNNYGNECWNLSWSGIVSIGVSVFASVEDCDFLDSLNVKLTVTEVTTGTYSINGSPETEYKNGDVITIGKDGKVGDKFVLTLKAGSGESADTKTYTYTKTDSPVGASIVYFDNSQFNWDKVYCYAYGTKENAEWPGKEMMLDSKSGYYYITFDAAYKSENILFSNGLEEEEEGYGKYPEASGLALKAGDCKLLTKELQWIDYGKPDSKPYGFAYIASGTRFNSDTLNVDIDYKNAVSASYQIDGGTELPYTGRTTISVGQGVIANSEITLTLKAKAADGTQTVTDLKYYKTFTPGRSYYYSPSDGSTAKPLGGYYDTNPGLKVGSYSNSIKVDGNPSDWNSSMLIAQGVANDDPRVYMPSSIHERSVDDYALYAAWDDENLYFMWEMANVSAVLGGKDIFSAQKPNGSIWNPGLPMFLVLSVDPEKHGDGKARELNQKTQQWVESASVWDSGLSFDTNIDTFITMDSANTNGGAAIIPLDDEGFFNYTESVNIGRPTNDPGVLNRNGFEIAWDYGTLSENIYGINGFGGNRKVGDTYDENSQWIDFFDEGYKKDAGFIYEIAVPLEHLKIDRSYIERFGIGAMLISTFGTSGMNTLPHDPAVLDNATKSYSLDPSTTHEKEDADKITVPLARIGSLLPDSVIVEAPFEIVTGADKSAPQGVGTELTFNTEIYGTDEGYEVKYKVNLEEIPSKDNKATWIPDKEGTYYITAEVTTSTGRVLTQTFDYAIGEAPEVIIPEPEPTTPSEIPTNPDETDPTTFPLKPDDPIGGSTDPTEPGNITVPVIPTESVPVVDTTPTDPEETKPGVTDVPVIPLPSDSTDPDATGTAAVIIPGTTASQPTDTVPVVKPQLILGDADRNCKVNIKDATLIQKHAAKITLINEGDDFKCADANIDGKLNVKDATLIQKHVAKIPVETPVGEEIKE